MKEPKAPLVPQTPAHISGRSGGLQTKERHGPDHFRRIGAMGGKSTAKRHGTIHYQRIGAIGKRVHARPAELPVPPNEEKMLAKATGGSARPHRLPEMFPEVKP